jgi:hypothetical protein
MTAGSWGGAGPARSLRSSSVPPGCRSFPASGVCSQASRPRRPGGVLGSCGPPGAWGMGTSGHACGSVCDVERRCVKRETLFESGQRFLLGWSSSQPPTQSRLNPLSRFNPLQRDSLDSVTGSKRWLRPDPRQRTRLQYCIRCKALHEPPVDRKPADKKYRFHIQEWEMESWPPGCHPQLPGSEKRGQALDQERRRRM